MLIASRALQWSLYRRPFPGPLIHTQAPSFTPSAFPRQQACRRRRHLQAPSMPRIARIALIAWMVPFALIVLIVPHHMQVPIMAKVAMLFFSLRKEQLKFTDERVKLINELVQGIRVIKMCAWETAMQKRIDAVRTHAHARDGARSMTRSMTSP